MTYLPAAKPLFRDPIYDGAADPTIIWNRSEKRWFMFYTNRRANVPPSEAPGVSWVHGTPIGIAESTDAGASWTYRCDCNFDFGQPDYTWWAPEVIEHDGTYHMYLSVVPGIFQDWNHPRDIVHLTSTDLIGWKYQSTLKLASNRVIDACIFRMPTGQWWMWYNNEPDHKAINRAVSDDLYHWTDIGKVQSDQAGEGPMVFRWRGKYFMIKDVWDGLAAYSSNDALTWIRQPKNILQTPGIGADDHAIGQHPSVILSEDRCYLIYFTHPERNKTPKPIADSIAHRRTSIQVVELQLTDGVLTCDRDQPTMINLVPPGSRG